MSEGLSHCLVVPDPSLDDAVDVFIQVAEALKEEKLVAADRLIRTIDGAAFWAYWLAGGAEYGRPRRRRASSALSA